MKNKLMKLLLSFSLVLVSYVHADCSIPTRLQVDMTVNDIAMYAVDMDSLSKSLLEEKGYSSYDEYSYSSDSFSKAIVQIQNNHKTLGSKYTNALIARLEEKEDSINKALARVLEQCDDSDFKSAIVKSVNSGLFGKNRPVEQELMQLNLNSISDALKAM